MLTLCVLLMVAMSCSQTPDTPPAEVPSIDAAVPTFEANWTLTSQGVSTQHSRREFFPAQVGARGLLYCTPNTLRISFSTFPHTSVSVNWSSSGTVGIELIMPGSFCGDPSSCHFHVERDGVGCFVRPIILGRPGEIHSLELAAPCRLVRSVRFGDPGSVEGDYIDLHSLRLRFSFRYYRVEGVDSGIVDCGPGFFD